MSDNELFVEAIKRVSYQLGYKLDPSREIDPINQFGQITLRCADMPNAYNPEDEYDFQSGLWYEDAPDVTTVDDAIGALFCAAIAEAVHEVCEWFHVDGVAFVDAHGDSECAVFNEAHAAAENILADREVRRGFLRATQ